jgi:hypothetical protein
MPCAEVFLLVFLPVFLLEKHLHLQRPRGWRAGHSLGEEA